MDNHILDELSIPVGHFADYLDIPTVLQQMYKAGWRVQPASKIKTSRFTHANEFLIIDPEGKQEQVYGTFAVVRFLTAQPKHCPAG